MRKTTLIVLTILLLTLSTAVALTTINNCTDLQNMQSNLAENYELGNEIDCSATSSWNSGAGFDPILGFTGTLDGMGYTVTNLYANRPSENSVALIGSATGAEIYNITVANATIIGGNFYTGVLGGSLSATRLNNTHGSGNVVGDRMCGGLIGVLQTRSAIDHSSFIGNVTANGSADCYHVGGLIGELMGQSGTTNYSYIYNSYADATVKGKRSTGGLVGGLYHYGRIYDSYSLSTIIENSGNGVGGLTGYMYEGAIIKRCYAATDFSNNASIIKGLVPYEYAPAGTYQYNYFDSDLIDDPSPIGATGKTTTQMKTQATFTGFDFTDTWGIKASVNNGYPYLKWQEVPPAPPIYDNFISSETTNLSNVSDYSSVPNVTLAITSKGKIKFDTSLNVDSQDLDSNVIINTGFVYVNTAVLHSSFNTSATLTFEGVDCNKPYIFYSENASTYETVLSDNTRCLSPQCTNIQCNAGTLTVDVAHFTGYATGSNANLTIDAETGAKTTGELIEFNASYVNATSGVSIFGECNISFDDAWGTEYEMIYNSGVYYNNKSFVSTGAHQFNITCYNLSYNTLEATDSKFVTGAGVPEFNIWTVAIGLLIIIAGLYLKRTTN